MTIIVNLWDYRHLIKKIAISDFKLRYKNSILGFFWSLLEPLLMLAVLYLVFTNFMRVKIEHYQLFLLMGIISWNMLGRGTTMSLNCILGKPSLVNKVYFPREVLVLSSCITAFMMTLLEFAVFGIFMLAFAVAPGMPIIYFPFVILAEFLLLLGLSFALAALNVFYRDIQYVWAVILQAGFFAAPIIYPLSFIPEDYLWVIRLNPMTEIIEMQRASVIYSTWPAMTDMVYIITTTLVILAIGYLVFLKLESRFAEEL